MRHEKLMIVEKARFVRATMLSVRNKLAHASRAAAAFAGGSAVVELEPFERGHIHRAFKIRLRTSSGPGTILLQRINISIFPDPLTLMENVSKVTEFLSRELGELGAEEKYRRSLALVEAVSGDPFWRDPDGDWWRAYRFIEGAEGATSSDPAHVERAAHAFGEFQRVFADYDGEPLAEMIPRFHDTPLRLKTLEEAVADDPCGRLEEVRTEVEECLDHRSLACALMEMRQTFDLPVRVVHNDAKLDNVLFDATTGEALCVVDLDTVGPGLAAIDFGDMVRSMSGGHVEDEVDLSLVGVREDLFTAISRGYLAAMAGVLNRAESRSLVLAGQVLTLEQAIRFLTDHLLGDSYYRISRPGQNLDRARVHLRLLNSLSERGPRLEQIVATAITP
jgi:hypothetical protein